MVLDVTPDKKIHCVSREKGYQILEARSIILCMGCRERTRAQIRIPGMRLTASSPPAPLNAG